MHWQRESGLCRILTALSPLGCFLQDATELDVDALADGQGGVVIGGIMEHIEQAGVHSGDSACSLPTQTIGAEQLATVREWTKKLALKLGVCGLMNIQYAVTPQGQVRGPLTTLKAQQDCWREALRCARPSDLLKSAGTLRFPLRKLWNFFQSKDVSRGCLTN